MIPHGSLDALADGQETGQPPVFLEIPGKPAGVEVSPTDGKIYVNTVGPVAGAPDPANGGIYALTRDANREQQAAAAHRQRPRGAGWPRLHRWRGDA